jgi:hypothetical protein
MNLLLYLKRNPRLKPTTPNEDFFWQAAADRISAWSFRGLLFKSSKEVRVLEKESSVSITSP